MLSFPVEISLWQSWMHCKVNNDIFSILCHQLHEWFPPLGVLVAVLDGCTVGTIWELLSVLWDARGLGGQGGVWCTGNARCRKRSSPGILILVSRLIVDEVPAECARWRLGCLVFINQPKKWNQVITGSRLYISILPANTSGLFSSGLELTASILNSLDITWLAQHNASRSKAPLIPCTTLYVPCGLPSATCNCIIMLMPQM